MYFFIKKLERVLNNDIFRLIIERVAMRSNMLPHKKESNCYIL